MFKTIKNLFKKEKVVHVSGEHITEIMEAVKNNNADIVRFDIGGFKTIDIPVVRNDGDGKAEFLGEGSIEDFEEQTKKDKGLWGLFGTKK